MIITYQTRKLKKTLNAEAAIKKEYGRMAKAIRSRIAVLEAARNLSQVPTTPPDRRHQLRGDRDEQYAVDLGHLYRLVFEPDHEPIPRKDDGGIDLEQVTAIRILSVVDYH